MINRRQQLDLVQIYRLARTARRDDLRQRAVLPTGLLGKQQRRRSPRNRPRRRPIPKRRHTPGPGPTAI